LKNGKLFRETKSYLPDASVVLLDEVFKSSSAVLNTLLRVLNERKFVNDGLEYCLPTQLVIGASNELPNEDMDALYDRFLIRHWIMPLEGKKLTDYINKVANGTINNNY
jgi:MoxR-like ATPase